MNAKNNHGAAHSYKGSALAKQEPTKQLSTQAQVKEARLKVSQGLQAFADLLSTEGALSVPALSGLYHVMHNEWDKVLGKLETAAKDALRDAVVSKGPTGKTESGGNKYEQDMDWGGGKFRVIGTESLPSEPDLKLLMAETGLKESQLTVQVISHEYSKDKVEALLAAGKLTQEQIDKCRKPKGKPSIKVEKL